MKWFSNLKISAKLIIGFVIVAIIAGVIGTVGLINLSRVGDADSQLYQQNTLGLNKIGNAEICFQRTRYNIAKGLMTTDPSMHKNCISATNDFITQADGYLNSYRSSINSPDDQKLFNDLINAWNDYKAPLQKAVAYLQAEDYENATALVTGQVQTTGNTVQTAFDQIFQYNTDSGNQKSNANKRLVTISKIVMLSVMAAGIVIATLLGVIISKIITTPVKKLMVSANKLAEGDVDIDIDISTKDEIGSLAVSFKKLIESIKNQAEIAERIAGGDLTVDVSIRSEKDILGKSIANLVMTQNKIIDAIVSSSDQVASGANMLSISSTTLSQGATEQASSIEELTASLEDVSSQIKKNAASAMTAKDLADHTQTNADEGNTQMKDMLEAMSEINISSGNISKIIKVIDDIAFQTNILALNAAVEAARAGQHGKGFAVVAEEVRNLAARSASAAKETTDLIESSIRKVEAGTDIASNTAAVLNKIVENVEKVAELVNEIAAASSEQSAGVQQINQGVSQISQVVQTNAATSEESAAASEELSAQATQLKKIVGVFKLRDNSDSARVDQFPRDQAQEDAQTPPVLEEASASSNEDYRKY